VSGTAVDRTSSAFSSDEERSHRNVQANKTEQLFSAAPARSDTCDGVVCFAAVDWWYHNQGHSECQIMRRLSRRVPVLWVNSIGMRAPSPGKSQFVVRRYTQKLRSTLKGLQRTVDGMWVYSPLFVPRYSDTMVTWNGRLLDYQLAWLLKRLNIRNPAAWVTIPTAAGAIDRRSWSRVIFNRSDDFSTFPEADPAFVRRLEDRLLGRADDVVYVNRALCAREQQLVRRAHYLGHGVDYDHFAAARPANGPAQPPEVLRRLPRPVIGYYGSLDSYTIDLELLRKVARSFPQATLLVIGPKEMDISPLLSEPNVVYTGPIPYADLPGYAGAFDVALMPWLQNEWIAACNPIKLKEYLALAFPVVTTRFPELKPYEPLVYPAASHDEFVAQIERALREDNPGLVQKRRDAVVQDSWDSLTDRVAKMFNLSPNLSTPR
jgi:hypothetical protein